MQHYKRIYNLYKFFLKKIDLLYISLESIKKLLKCLIKLVPIKNSVLKKKNLEVNLLRFPPPQKGNL